MRKIATLVTMATAMLLVAALLATGDAFAGRRMPTSQVTWSGRGMTSDGDGGYTLNDDRCDESEGAPYILFVLASTKAINSAYIKFGSDSPIAMEKSNTDKRGTSTWKYLYTPAGGPSSTTTPPPTSTTTPPPPAPLATGWGTTGSATTAWGTTGDWSTSPVAVGGSIDLAALLAAPVKALYTSDAKPTLTASHGCAGGDSVDVDITFIGAVVYPEPCADGGALLCYSSVGAVPTNYGTYACEGPLQVNCVDFPAGTAAGTTKTLTVASGEIGIGLDMPDAPACGFLAVWGDPYTAPPTPADWEPYAWFGGGGTYPPGGGVFGEYYDGPYPVIDLQLGLVYNNDPAECE